MSNLRNSVRLTGFLGSAPEVKNISETKKVAKLNLATSDSYKNEKVEETQWHNLVAWNAQATIAEKYLQKGSEVSIEGKLTSRNYVNKDGIKCYVTEVIVNEILLMGKK
jgi:single-strand DNA-binding protein